MEEPRATVTRPRAYRGAELYVYTWRGRPRRVWVCATRAAVNAVLDRHWPRGVTSVDVEYDSRDGRGGVPRVVSVALDRHTALLWHRPRHSPDSDRPRRMPSLLVELLSKSSVPKIGFALDEDLRRLAEHTDWLERGGWPRGALDLQTWWRVFGPADEFGRSLGLADAVERYTGTTVAKHLRFDRPWDAQQLSLGQVVYAAGDVLAALDMWAHIRARHHSAGRGRGGVEGRGLER